MSKYRNLDFEDPFPATYTDALEEFISTVAANLSLRAASSTTVAVAAATGPGQVCVGVDGKWRYNSAQVTAAMPGGATAATYDVLAVASANSFTGGPNETDSTDYSFGLQIVTTGASATGNWNGHPITNWRKIGEVDYDGAKITGLRQLAGPDTTLPLTPTAAQPSITPLRVRAAASQTADVVRAESSVGGAYFRVSNTGYGFLNDGLQTRPGDANQTAIDGSGIRMGASFDTQIFRVSAGVLRTPGDWIVGDPGNALGAGGTHIAANYGEIHIDPNASGSGATCFRIQNQSDAQPRLYMTEDGEIFFGNGAGSFQNLFYSTASGGEVVVKTGQFAVAGALFVDQAQFWVRPSSVSSSTFMHMRVQGEANDRWNMDGTGKVSFGPGGATATDTIIQRSAANTLKIGTTNVTVGTNGPSSQPGIAFGTGGSIDTNLFRSNSNEITSNGAFIVQTTLTTRDLLQQTAGTIGFYGTAGQTKKTVTGSRGANVALASLLTALAGYGLITDSST